MVWYLDSSAAAKLVLPEEESPRLAEWAAAHAGAIVSSDLLRTELARAVRRTAPDRMQLVAELLDFIGMLPLPAALFERAGRLSPDALRSLDAIHLAAALDLGDDLDGLVTYDDRLAAAATSSGVAVVAPA